MMIRPTVDSRESKASRRFKVAAQSGLLFLGVWLTTATAKAGTFDGQGEYLPDPYATVYLDFSQPPERYVPDDVDPDCMDPMLEMVTQDDALDGNGLLKLRITSGCFERLLLPLPHKQASYRASVWMRHGGVTPLLIAVYPPESGVDTQRVRLTPTGRTTSDGWVELVSNAFSVDGSLSPTVYLRLRSYAAVDGVDLDALEIVPEGEYYPANQACFGRSDPVCGDEGVCVFNRCRAGGPSVPPLPADAIRHEVVDVLQSKIRVFYGGKRSRAQYMPEALARMEQMRKAETAWEFWNGFAGAITALHDWHTFAGGGPDNGTALHRLNACFYEGDADLTHGTWPKDPQFADILVSHGGEGAAGLSSGDRLVAVDGMHPIAWVKTLSDVQWGFANATDPDIFADYAERLGGPWWSGGSLIVKYATTLTVIRCNASTGTCANLPETIKVEDLAGDGGTDVLCDNRPFYSLEPSANPNANTHEVWGDFFRGRVANTTQQEAIFGMIWDTLYGAGDPNGWVNGHISDAIADWKANARGVILDHRAGNGGTLDTPTLVTTLIRPKDTMAVVRMPISFGGYDGPADLAEGQAIFEAFKNISPYNVGADDFDPDLPVALLIHRDGSASDYLPLGFKGAPKARIFGPHASVGAFSTFIEFTHWGGLNLQLASGDTIRFDGQAMIGHGVQPDQIVLPKQSDLLMGKDSVFEAALAWVRQELKP